MASVASRFLSRHPLQEDDFEVDILDFTSLAFTGFDRLVNVPDPLSVEFHSLPSADRFPPDRIPADDMICDESCMGIVEENASNIVPRRFEESDSLGGFDFGVFDEVDEMDCLGLDSAVNVHAGSDNGHFAGLRRSSSTSFWTNDEISEICLGHPFQDGRRVYRLDSNSDSEEDSTVNVDFGLDSVGAISNVDVTDDSLHLDCLTLHDRRDPIEDLEWEEVDLQPDGEAIQSMLVNDALEEVRGSDSAVHEMGFVTNALEDTRNLGWEVLWSMNTLDENHSDMENEMTFENDGYTEAAEYEVLNGQFVDDEISMGRNLPAAKSVVENLQTVVLTQKDVDNEKTLCAVCKDDILMGEKAKQLPCYHVYHGGCIFPWLRIRNTCPVCRFELPVDDPEHSKGQRVAHFLSD